ncbi:1-phosphatidylinositol 4,5-bisphosphate phosphodiesterase eta-2 isoform X3 [Sapajus apella]|uniref:Phosphoinositide phospholipase C n=1 Tax=Sapajus apella TaxID=9515 RepID=A0A6J3GJ61_SAPAP|nr:1-phosphatidylinositol 4,5-bisphosphate phosphodiesterase eta-2 isoform X3 [Sapajus apella]XP_032118053.1 1-phosphatidylinositol 4,5-bisphosphate phosphodiesterase eta-2 isoform X3 [Sapajus apella]XP_032118054.1 1-phosphatidylinositol 4,5-bisphosphate phosphodiesterase eta-2 isoform X3 [Sapajus apella]
MMAPPTAGPLPGRALPSKDPGPDLESRWLFLSANILPVVERCLGAMQEGMQMVKLRGGSKGLVRFYYLDEHRSCIRWRPSRKNEKAKICIDAIQEVSEGRQSEVFQRYPDGSFDPNCCFSIYHGSHRESLDLVSTSSEVARTWVTGLRYLMAGIRDEDSLARRQRTRDQWLKQTFDEADKNGDGSLSVSEVLRLLHKLNVNLPRQRVKQMFREADTDDHQGTLGFEEFCAFYKMMSTRRDLYLLMLTYSSHKDHLDAASLQRFLQVEQKMTAVTLESCQDIIEQFEPCPENRSKGLLGIDGFTNYTRSPAGDISNPEHRRVHQDMTRPLSHYFITSSHNTYLVGDQLMSQSRVDMYAWVLQAGCRCVEVDCWDGPDGEPIVHHGYTLTSKILFKDVIETINKYAFIKNEYPVILSIENHCSVIQQKKMAQYLTDILGDKLDLSSVSSEDATTLPSPQMLKGKILVKGKKLPANISEDAEEGEVSDEDSADEIDDDCKLLNGDASTNRKRVENIAKRKLDSLIKESKIRDCEDPNDFSVSTLSPSGKLGHKVEAKKSKAEEDAESGEDTGASRRNSRLVVGSFSRRKKKGSKLKKAASVEEGDEGQDSAGGQSRGTARQKKTMQLSRALSDLVKYTKSVATHDIEVEAASSWQVSSFSETRAQQILQQKPAQFLRFNQQQLSRIYPSSYRVDSSNYNPQPFWNAGCQMVALNYQSEGRMLQLNRAKFSANGGCGYVLKPECMCQGMFNPNSEDPLPGQLKKQLVLRIISGQQLPKPRDSMLGDRGEIIDPFVEVEVIGLPVDCSREQTRVVDDNGFNPTWEETLVFTVHMPEIALVRFLVWDHDPIGRDFIGQRTLAFSSMMPGYRHVYLEGMEEASIFVHVAVSDISGKVKQALGLKGLFLRGPKPGSLDSHAAGRPLARPSVSQRLLRRTASAPTKSQKPGRKGFPELVLGTQDVGSKGAADMVPPSPGPAPEAPAQEGPSSGSPRGKAPAVMTEKSPVRVQPPRAPEGLGPAGMAATCMKCVVGSCAGVNTEGLWRERPPGPGPASRHAAIRQQPQAREDSMGGPCSGLDPRALSGSSTEAHKGPGAWGQGPGGSGSMSSDASSPDSPGSPEVGAHWPEGACRQPGALQGEMSALFAQKLEAIRRKSPMFSADTRPLSAQRPLPAPCSLETIAEEPAPGPGPPPPVAIPTNSSQEWPLCPTGPGTNVASPPEDPEEPRDSRPRPCHGRGPGEACEGGPGSQTDGRSQPRTLGPLLIRRVKSEGQVPTEPLAGPFPAPAVYSDATGSDRLWQRLEPHGHRDSVSSSSSMSSSDTVIDLSLPSLGLGHSRECLAGGPVGRLPPRPHLASAARPDLPPVTKSKSNPNLRAAGQRPPTPEDPRPRPLAPRMPGLPLRPPWGRLSLGSLQDCPVAAKSKSLGDLTADDFAPSSEGGSHSLGLPQGAQRVLGPGVRRDILTEQLRWLTVFQQAGDITSPTSLGAAGDGVTGGPGFLRRSSSRSQSRVRAIASRARQAQERQQRLQGRGRQGPPEEERGTPEGACSVGREGRVDAPAPSKGAPGPASAATENLVLLRL